MPWLLLAYPYDPALPGIRTLVASDAGFVSEPTDPIPNTYFDRRVEVPFRVQQALFSGGDFGGLSSVALGSVELVNRDGGLDGWAAYDWDGRAVELRWTSKDRPVWADFQTVFNGTAERLVLGDRLRIEIRDMMLLLDVPAQPARFAGTGGAEGVAALKNRRKPLALGRCRRVEPLLLTGVVGRQIYHCGGAAQAAWDQAVALTFFADYASFAALDAAILAGTIPAGSYGTCTAEGLIGLGAIPAGIVTADVFGTAAADLASLVPWLVDYATDLSASDFATGTLTALAALCPQPLGLWLPGDETTVQQAVSTLCSSVGAWLAFNPQRKIVMGRYGVPGTPSLTLTDRDLIAIEPRPVARRAKSVDLGYRRYGRPLTENEVAASVADKADLALAYRRAVQTSASAAAECLLAREITADTCLDVEADATTEAARRAALFGAQRRAFAFTTEYRADLTPGITITLLSARYGLAAGADFVVMQVEHDATANRSAGVVWG